MTQQQPDRGAVVDGWLRCLSSRAMISFLVKNSAPHGITTFDEWCNESFLRSVSMEALIDIRKTEVSYYQRLLRQKWSELARRADAVGQPCQPRWGTRLS